MTTQEFVVSVSSDHLHYATVDELPNPFGEGSLGTCTIKTVLIVEEGSCTSQECLIWATGPSVRLSASQISTGPPNLSQNVLLLYPDEGDGLELLYDAFGTDTGEGCVFSGSHPIVCRVGNSAVKIGREEVSEALCAFKESDPLTGAQSAHSLRSDFCVTPVVQLKEGTHGQWVDVWVPGPTRTTLISGPI